MLAAELPFTGESPTVIMMKQVQDPPPSIQEIRPEVPTTVAQIILKALAKQPADRFQTAGELSEALSKAAQAVGEPELAAVPATVPNAPVPLVDDADEATLVRARDAATMVRPHEVAPVGPPVASVRPWRIMLPAAIVLVAVFALVFFLTRSAGQNQSANANVNQPGLVADPNSQPVQQVGTPTGESEVNIQPQPISSATPHTLTANANENSNSNNNTNANARVQSTPATVIGNFGSNGNRNSNLGEAPTPAPRVKLDTTPPQPKVIPSVKPAAKPTASPIQ
jgi:serine/threonine-protein kinase